MMPLPITPGLIPAAAFSEKGGMAINGFHQLWLGFASASFEVEMFDCGPRGPPIFTQTNPKRAQRAVTQDSSIIDLRPDVYVGK